MSGPPAEVEEGGRRGVGGGGRKGSPDHKRQSHNLTAQVTQSAPPGREGGRPPPGPGASGLSAAPLPLPPAARASPAAEQTGGRGAAAQRAAALRRGVQGGPADDHSPSPAPAPKEPKRSSKPAALMAGGAGLPPPTRT